VKEVAKTAVEWLSETPTDSAGSENLSLRFKAELAWRGSIRGG